MQGGGVKRQPQKNEVLPINYAWFETKYTANHANDMVQRRAIQPPVALMIAVRKRVDQFLAWRYRTSTFRGDRHLNGATATKTRIWRSKSHCNNYRYTDSYIFFKWKILHQALFIPIRKTWSSIPVVDSAVGGQRKLAVPWIYGVE